MLDRIPTPDPVLREALGRLQDLLSRGERDEALLALESLSAEDPYDERIPLLSCRLSEERSPAAAASRALRSVAIRPFNPEALACLARCCRRVGESELADRLEERRRTEAPGADAPAAAGSSCSTADGFPRAEVERVLAEAPPTIGALVLDAGGDDERLAVTVDSCRAEVDEIHVVRLGGAPASGLDGVSSIRYPGPLGDGVDARNAGLKQLSTDWILVLDVGEVLRTEAGSLRRSVQTESALGLTAVVRDRNGHRSYLSPRLVRNAIDLRFRGGGAASLLPAIADLEARWSIGLDSSEIVVEREEIVELSSLTDDERAAFLRCLTECDGGGAAESRRLRALRARALAACGRHEDAVRESEAILDELEGLRAFEAEEPATIAARGLLALGKPARALERIDAFFAEHGPTANLSYLRGVAAEALGNRDEALTRFTEALSGATGWCPTLPEVAGPALAVEVGRRRIDRRELAAAREAFARARELDPLSVEALVGLVGVDFAENDLERALHRLDDLVRDHGDDPRTWLAGEIVLRRVPALAEGFVAWMQEAHERFPHDDALRRRLGEACLLAGRCERAMEIWERDPEAPLGGMLAAQLAEGRPLATVPHDAAERLTEEVLAWFERWLTWNTCIPLDRALVDLARADSALPTLRARTGDWLTRVGQSEAAERLASR